MERRSNIAFVGGAKVTGAPAAANAGEYVEYAQWLADKQGISWKDNVRVASTANINLASPGTTIDGITMSNGDRLLAKDQTTQTQNGIYIFNGSAVAATRATDADTFDKLESAVVRVDEGTANGGTQWQQTQVNGVIDTNNVVWASNQNSAPSASESTAGIAEIATTSETNTGTDDLRIVTPKKLKEFTGFTRKYSTTVGNGSLTQIDVSHNLGTTDVIVAVYIASSGAEIECDKTRTDSNTVRLNFTAAPANNELKVVVIG
jgi:hypothetical protein